MSVTLLDAEPRAAAEILRDRKLWLTARFEIRDRGPIWRKAAARPTRFPALTRQFTSRREPPITCGIMPALVGAAHPSGQNRVRLISA
jgi:hypothetical protein